MFFFIFIPLIDIHHPKRIKAWTLCSIIKFWSDKYKWFLQIISILLFPTDP